MRTLAHVIFALLAVFIGARAYGADVPALDAAERLALWGYEVRAWELLRTGLPSAALGTGTAFTPHQQAQVQYVRIRFNISVLIKVRDSVELNAFVESQLGDPSGKAAKSERDLYQKKLSAAAAAARSSCKELQRIAQSIHASTRTIWMIRGLASEAYIALVLDELQVARGLAHQALAVPNADTVAERALIHLTMAFIAGKEHDARARESEISAGLVFLEARGGRMEPYYSSLLYEKILHLVDGTKFDAAFDAIGQYSLAQRAGPGESLRAWREFGIANLLYQIGRPKDAERALKTAIEDQLLAVDEKDAEKLNDVRGMLNVSGEDPHSKSRVSVAKFLLMDDIRARFSRFPEYLRLIDKYAIVAAKAGDVATMSAVEFLRGTAGELSVARDEQAKNALIIIERTDPKKLLASLRKELSIPDLTGEQYFLNVFVLECALRRLRDVLGIGAPEVEEVVHSITHEHQAASRNDLANDQLLNYRADVLDDVAGVEGTRRSVILDGISRSLRDINDPKSADDAAELSELSALRGRAKKCQSESDAMTHVVVCKQYVAYLLQANRAEDAIDVLLQLHDEMRSNRKHLDTLAPFLAEITDALYDAIQHTELGPSRDFFFYVSGASRRVRIAQLCTGVLTSQSLGRKISYCAARFLYGRTDSSSANVTQERGRLLTWASQSGEISLLATLSAEAPRVAIASLQSYAKNSNHELDSRRLALLLACEMRSKLAPRNETTESELLLDLAELYATDDGGPLMLGYAEQAFEINLHGGGTTIAFLRRVLGLFIAGDTGERHTVALIDRVILASRSIHVPVGSLTFAEVASVEFVAASNLPQTPALVALEGLVPRLVADIGFLTMKSTSIGLDAFCTVLLHASRPPLNAPRAYKLLRTVLQYQDRRKVQDPLARSTVLLAALNIAQVAGAGAELPMLFRELRQVQHVGEYRLPVADAMVAAWDGAMNAAGALRYNEAAVARLTEISPWDQVYLAYQKAITSAMDARQFDHAELLLNSLLTRNLEAVLQFGAVANLNSLHELKLGYRSPCSLHNGRLSAPQSLLPGTLQQCGAAMATWHRNLALYETFESILAKFSDPLLQRIGHEAPDLDDFLAWEAALANEAPEKTDLRTKITFPAVDFIRSPDAFLGNRRGDARSALARIRTILAGQGGAARHIPGKLQDDEALVLFHLTKSAMFSWTVTRRGVAFKHWDASRAEIRAAITNARRQFYLSVGTTELPSIKLSPLLELYRRLLEPLEAELRGVTQLYVVPNGALALVPYGVLVTQVPRADPWPPNSAWRPDWLLDRMGVGVIRSLDDFRAKASSPSDRPGKLFLGVGDPVITGWDDALRIATPCIAQLPKLDSAADELNQVAGIFGVGASDVLARNRFTLSELAAVDWSMYRYVLIASHTLQADVGGCVSESGIVTSAEASAITPPLLTASFVAERRLDADLVVLSACESGIDDLYKEDQPVGSLANAFLHAGARSVVASSWPMVSARAEIVTTTLFRSLSSAKNRDVARALRHSMLSLSASPDRLLSHPLVWGSLFLVGSQ